MKSNIPTNVLYQFVTKEKVDYIEIYIRDEHGRSIDFNGDVLGLIFHCVKELAIVICLDIVLDLD